MFFVNYLCNECARRATCTRNEKDVYGGCNHGIKRAPAQTLKEFMDAHPEINIENLRLHTQPKTAHDTQGERFLCNGNETTLQRYGEKRLRYVWTRRGYDDEVVYVVGV